VSKRSKRRRDPGHGAGATARTGVPEQPVAERAGRQVSSDWNLGVQLAFLVAVFAVVVLVAELAGAANLGVALGVGQVAFAIAVVYLLVRR
jgi:hypothetical protein